MAIAADTASGTLANAGDILGPIGPVHAADISIQSFTGSVVLERYINDTWQVVRTYSGAVETMEFFGARRTLGRLRLVGSSGPFTATISGDDGTPSALTFAGIAGRIQVNDAYASANGKAITSETSLGSLFSDDFGGSAIDATNWTVLDGGLGANPNLGNGTLTQAKIGSGITGMTDSVANSALTVVMGTTLGAERWYLSNQTFAGKEDILVILSRSQANVNNSIFIGLVEVDPAALVPLLNPNIAADGNGSSEFTNRGGLQAGLTASSGSYNAEAIGDSSSAVASGPGGATGTALTTAQEFLIEIDSRDITVSSAAADSTNAKSSAVRVSTQCPNDRKLYKLVMRFRNIGTPTATSVVIQRIIVIDNYEQRVQVSTAEGDQIGSKALAVNIVGTLVNGVPQSTTLQAFASSGSSTYHKLTSAATTNATSVKTSNGTICGGSLRNRAASERYFKFYNKASAPTVGTDTPVLTIGIPAGSIVTMADFVGAVGLRLGTGIAYAITGAYADADTTAIAAGDVDVNLIYS